MTLGFTAEGEGNRAAFKFKYSSNGIKSPFYAKKIGGRDFILLKSITNEHMKSMLMVVF